jgi:hypothetical protein
MSSNNTIEITKICSEGKMQEKYSALHNLLTSEGQISAFRSDKLNYNLNSSIEIDTQLSYDDSINLILNNNIDSPRIINSRFAKLGNDKYEYIVRTQQNQTNIYTEDNVDSETDLFLRSNK